MGRLFIQPIGTIPVGELLKRAALLPEGKDAQWQELLLYFFAAACARIYEPESEYTFRTWFWHSLLNSAHIPELTVSRIAAHENDSAWLLGEARKRLPLLLAEGGKGAADGSWAGVDYSDGIEEEEIWYQFTEPDCSYRISLRLPEGEVQERLSLEITIDNADEGEVRLFGPILAALVFGEIVLGQSRFIRATRLNVTLQLGRESEREPETAAQALRRLTDIAEERSPEILLF